MHIYRLLNPFFSNLVEVLSLMFYSLKEQYVQLHDFYHFKKSNFYILLISVIIAFVLLFFIWYDLFISFLDAVVTFIILTFHTLTIGFALTVTNTNTYFLFLVLSLVVYLFIQLLNKINTKNSTMTINSIIFALQFQVLNVIYFTFVVGGLVPVKGLDYYLNGRGFRKEFIIDNPWFYYLEYSLLLMIPLYIFIVILISYMKKRDPQGFSQWIASLLILILSPFTLYLVHYFVYYQTINFEVIKAVF